MALVALFALWASATDAKRRLLPNRLLGPMCISALGCQLLRILGPRCLRHAPWLAALDPGLAPPLTCLSLALTLAVTLSVVELLQRRLRHKPGLGFGDIKLAAVWTLALGTWGIVALTLGCAAGAIHALWRGERTFPLGPYMTVAAIALATTLPLLA